MELTLQTTSKPLRWADAVQEISESGQSNAVTVAGALTLEGGRIAQTISNVFTVLTEDVKFSMLRYNEVSGQREYHTKYGVREWSEADDAAARRYIESKYFIRGKDIYETAMMEYFAAKAYNPIKDRIESIVWDGTSRIKTMLTKWMGCEDSEYVREVSRLIFAGGINRLYRPGCKFDDMPVLIGLKQGEGKSTFVRWLAMEDEWYREVNDIDGRTGMESIRGAWICEVSELLALTKTKEKEAVKSYLSRTSDDYRESYGRYLTRHPRTVVFVGTTNKQEIVHDPSGARRFYPVVCNSSGYDLFDHKEEVWHDIEQCWAEAKYALDHGDDIVMPYADKRLKPIIAAQQEAAQEDDYRVGLIQVWLEEHKRVGDLTCVLEVWTQALGEHFSKPNRKDAVEIGQILTKLPICERVGNVLTVATYGRQKAWRIVREETSNTQSDDPETAAWVRDAQSVIEANQVSLFD